MSLKQHRIPCPHIDDTPAEFTMASEVTENSRSRFLNHAEHRVHWELSADDLKSLLSEAINKRDCPLVACNQCRRLFFVTDDGLELAHRGQPRSGGTSR